MSIRADAPTTPVEPDFSEAMTALRGDAPLAVYVDLKSPYAYIALEPTRAMARAVGVEIDWRPFTLDIPSYLGSAQLGRDGKTVAKASRSPAQWSGVKYAYHDVRRYASVQGKVVRGTVKIWDSSRAAIALLWARERGRFEALADVLYPPFWRRELDIEDWTVLESALADAGLPTGEFRAWAEGPGRALHDRMNEEAFNAGIYGVPTFLVEDEAWFGREHLPRVEWILKGRPGAAPGVANRSFGR